VSLSPHRPLSDEERRRVWNPDRDHERWLRPAAAARRIGITTRQVFELVDQGRLEFEVDEIDGGMYVAVDGERR
jgi:hypothetical protein